MGMCLKVLIYWISAFVMIISIVKISNQNSFFKEKTRRLTNVFFNIFISFHNSSFLALFTTIPIQTTQLTIKLTETSLIMSIEQFFRTLLVTTNPTMTIRANISFLSNISLFFKEQISSDDNSPKQNNANSTKPFITVFY